MLKPGQKALSPLKPGEPTFVIRATDNFSLAVLRILQPIYGIEKKFLRYWAQWRKDNQGVCHDPD